MVPKGKYLVIYVDDDRDDIELMTEAFNHYPHIDFRTFSDAVNFLRFMNQPEIQPSLVLIDINMPLLNGRDVLKRLRSYQHLRDVAMVLYTTSSSREDEAYAKSFGAEMVTKPYTQALFDKTVTRLLEGNGLV